MSYVKEKIEKGEKWNKREREREDEMRRRRDEGNRMARRREGESCKRYSALIETMASSDYMQMS